MASETLLINADLVIGTGVSLVGGASATAVLGDDDLATYLRTSSSVTTNNITLDQGIRLGLPQPIIAAPITRVECELTFNGYSDDSAVPGSVFVSFWGLRKVDLSPLQFLFNGDAPPFTFTKTQKLSAITNLTPLDIATVEVWISTSSQSGGIPQPTTIYELKVHVHNTPAVGYDAPPDPIAEVLLNPPRRRFVYPY